jgi:hypothetical protein
LSRAEASGEGERDTAIFLAALEGLAEKLPASAIDELWIFPVRRSGNNESTVIVASAFVEGDDARRRIITAHLTNRQVQGKILAQRMVDEQGIAPAERIGRLVHGVLRRLDEELAALPPREVSIQREPARWDALVQELTNTGRAEPVA